MSLDVEAHEHEEAFIQAFIVRKLRNRYLAKLNSRKYRAEFLDRLNHRFVADLDERYISNANPTSGDQFKCRLYYVIAVEHKFDSQLVTLDVAAEMIESAVFGIVVSYIPGRLAVYKDEAPSELLWLVRS